MENLDSNKNDKEYKLGSITGSKLGDLILGTLIAFLTGGVVMLPIVDSGLLFVF
jgi:hypothetical protein